MPSFSIPHFLLRSYSFYDSQAACMRVFVCVKNGIHTTGTSHSGFLVFFITLCFIFLNKHFSKHSYIFLLESVRFMSTIHPLIFFSPVSLFFPLSAVSLSGTWGQLVKPLADSHPCQSYLHFYSASCCFLPWCIS